MTRHSRVNVGVARSRMITTEEYLRAMFGEQGEGWNMANTAGARGRGGVYDVSGMFASEWETQLDDSGLPVFADQAGYRPAGVNGPGAQADWFGALFSQGDDGEADEGGNAVSGREATLYRVVISLQRRLVLPEPEALGKGIPGAASCRRLGRTKLVI